MTSREDNVYGLKLCCYMCFEKSQNMLEDVLKIYIVLIEILPSKSKLSHKKFAQYVAAYSLFYFIQWKV